MLFIQGYNREIMHKASGCDKDITEFDHLIPYTEYMVYCCCFPSNIISKR